MRIIGMKGLLLCSISTASAFVLGSFVDNHRKTHVSPDLRMRPDVPSFAGNDGFGDDRFGDYYNDYYNRNKDGYFDGNGYDDEYYRDAETVHLTSEGGRPMHASVQEWRTSGHTPFKVDTYSQNSRERSLRLESPSRDGAPHSLAIRNTASLEFPLEERGSLTFGGNYQRHVDPSSARTIQGGSLQTYSYRGYNNPGDRGPGGGWPSLQSGDIIQGEGAVKTYGVPAHVQEVRVILSSDQGYDVKARIEVLQGPNNVMQSFDVESENGRTKPFIATIDTPGYAGHTIRIENTGPMTYPIRAEVQPLETPRDGRNEGMNDVGRQQNLQYPRRSSPSARRLGSSNDPVFPEMPVNPRVPMQNQGPPPF